MPALAQSQDIGQVEGKKHNLLIHAGPARTGTTYIFDLLATHPDKEFRSTAQPPKGWNYYDHSEELYRAGEISWDKWFLRRVRSKEGELIHPNFRDIVIQCMEVHYNNGSHEDCFIIMERFFKTMNHDADWDLVLSPDIMNYRTIHPYIPEHSDINNFDSKILSPDESCKAITAALEVSKNVYRTVLDGLSKFDATKKIEFVIGLRDPYKTFESWCILKQANDSIHRKLFNTEDPTVQMPDHLDVDQSSILDMCILGLTNPDDVPASLIAKINMYILEFTFIIRQYEQFEGLREYYESSSSVDVKFMDCKKLNNPEDLAKTFSMFSDIEKLKLSPVLGEKTNSWYSGMFPGHKRHLVLTQEDSKFSNAHEIDTDYSIVRSKSVEFVNLLERGLSCCNANRSNKFVSEQIEILDK